MPKNLVCKISLLISWMTIFSSPFVGCSSSYKTQIPDSDFPYAYWKPVSTNHYFPSLSDPNNDTHYLSSYGHYYGEPISTEDDFEDPTSWNASPIKVPKDVVGEVNERTTVQPSPYSIVTPYPSSFTPQYGRHPGATESQPLYFSQNVGNSYYPLERVGNRHSSYSRYNPIQNPIERKEIVDNIPNSHFIIKQQRNPLGSHSKLEPFTNSEVSNYNYRSTLIRPAKLVNIVNIDRHDEPPPHVFYAIEDPSQVDMKILHKNGTHSKYTSIAPQEQRRRYFIDHPNRVWAPRFPHRHFVRPKHRSRYNWYNKRKKFEQPYYPRKKYNENIFDLMKNKVGNKVRKNFDLHPKNTYSATQNVYHSENEIKSSPVKDNQNKYIEDYNHINKPESNVVSIVKATNLSEYITSDTVFIPKPVPVNTKYTEPYPQASFPTRQHSQISHDFDNYGKFSVPSATRVPKPAPNAYPDHNAYSNHYRPNNNLYIYNKNQNIRYEEEDEEDYDAFAQKIMERMAGLQSIPASVVIPGGLAALGLGLAYYYFNYVWYPTPVVTARLSEFLRSLDYGDNFRKEESASAIGKIIEVFRSLENAQFSSELGKDSCRNRIVCQIHQDIPNMLDATRVITPFLSTKPQSSELNKAVQTYLSTARRGSRSKKSCKDMYRSCKLPYISLKPIISLFFRPKKGKEKNSVE